MSKMKENIEKAQIEIEAKEGVAKNGKMRQDFHFMPQAGWLNDPNGFIYYKGLNVLFRTLNDASNGTLF